MPVDFIDDDLWDATLNVNLRAGVMICRALIEPFRRSGPGSAVVFISSIEGLFGSVLLTAYCASKGGVLGVMRSIAHRFASEGFRVNAVCPGAVDTPMLAPAFELPGFPPSSWRSGPPSSGCPPPTRSPGPSGSCSPTRRPSSPAPT